ncbi:MAG TPA: glycine--tRNA ligase subunit alpha, partial [Lactobacillus sp.]|nr:glycine--tRNA ligase subunit alpha [Lactobacillus sp.]
LLDARGAVSVTERAGYLSRIRRMAHSVARAFVAKRKEFGFPLIKDEEKRQALLADGEDKK